ncbi:MAG: GNAT family N-acetyltransferase [Tuberibacillus sp.]
MSEAFTFRRIDVERDHETLLKHRKDSFLVSLGTDDTFGDPNHYLAWMALQTIFFPDGFLLMEHVGKTVGQLEVEIVTYQGRRVGYVDLFYLIPGYRGKGYGRIQLERAEEYLRSQGMDQYHLRVSATNKPALRFYEKHGFYKLKEENIGGYIMYRMVKELT